MSAQAQPQAGQIAQAIATIATLPSLTVLPMLRRHVGFRLLKPLYIVLATMLYGFVVGFGSLVGALRYGGQGATRFLVAVLFGAAFIALASWQRRQGFNDLLSIQRHHPDGRGISRLANFAPALPLNRFQRFVEPALVFGLGLLLRPVAGALGLWLMFAGVTLLLAESFVFERQIDWIANEVSARLNASVMEEEHDAREAMERIASLPPATRQETTSQPAGLSSELRARIEENKRRLAAGAPPVAAPAGGYAPTPALAQATTAAPSLPPGIAAARRAAAAPTPGHPVYGNQPNPDAPKGHEWDHVLGPPGTSNGAGQ